MKAFALREGGPSNDRPGEIDGALAVIYLFIYLFIKLRQKIITVIIIMTYIYMAGSPQQIKQSLRARKLTKYQK